MLTVEFFSLARARLETALLAGRPHRGMECRQRLWMSMSGRKVGRRLKDCPVVVDLDELGPVGGRPTGGRDGRRSRCMRNQRTTRRRTFSVSAARSTWVIDRAGSYLRQAACPQEGRRPVTGRDEDAVGRARMQMHVVIERRSEAVQKGDAAESRVSRARPVTVTGRARRSTKQPLAAEALLHWRGGHGGGSVRPCADRPHDRVSRAGAGGRRAYYAAVTMLDEQVGRLLALLRSRGLLDNTVIVFTSDHGYHRGSRGQWCKHSIDEQVMRVPRIVRFPGGPQRPTGWRAGAFCRSSRIRRPRARRADAASGNTPA